jgi:glutathione S-transferase
VLIDDDFAVWDSLAIAEYLHEKFPERGVWPAAMRARARARSICAEMHAGFAALRSACPMNIEASMPEVGERLWVESDPLRTDVARLEALWAEALEASGGPFLFGAFSAADAVFAPVALRLRTYALPVSAATRAYMERLIAAPGPAAWIADALQEHEFVVEDEPYRKAR